MDINLIKIPIGITPHGQDYQVEYQNANKITASFETDNGLIALVGLNPKSFITTRMKGDILINRELSEDMKTDIISMYLIVIGFLRETQSSSML